MPYSAEPAAEIAPETVRSVPAVTAMARGFLGRCPNCGKGRLFGRFLKVAVHCDSCGTELHHHRADDFPPYIVMFIVGHLVGYGILMTETRMDVPMWFQLALWPALTLVLCLALLQPVKGAVVGLQYALGMHGFGVARAKGTDRESERDGQAGAVGTDGSLRVRNTRS
jgi:uncharacterized protein (DUF983 family)